MREVAAEFTPEASADKAAYDAAYPPWRDVADHLRESLCLATGLAELIADDADIRETHGESLLASNTEAAARAISLILRIASIQAEALARQRDKPCRQGNLVKGEAKP